MKRLFILKTRLNPQRRSPVPGFAFFLILFLWSVTACGLQKSVQTEIHNPLEKAIVKPGERHAPTTILATFYPLYIMILNITDGAETQVELLAPPDTGCLHDYQLTVGDMKRLEKADIVVINGGGMESFVSKVLLQKTMIITASDGYPLTDDNPHVWVSPAGAIYQTHKIAEELSRLDSKNTEIYKRNAAEYILKLEKLSERMHTQLDKFSGSSAITFHEAFPYFADEFNLKIAGVIQREAGSEPNPKELKETIDIIQRSLKTGEKIALFAENQYSATAAEVISRETGLPVYLLDPGVTGQLKKNAYIEMMDKNAKILTKALE